MRLLMEVARWLIERAIPQPAPGSSPAESPPSRITPRVVDEREWARFEAAGFPEPWTGGDAA